MRTRLNKDSRPGTERTEGIPEMRPWREVGWIFRNGDALAIERRGDRTRVRTTSVHHRRQD